MVVVSFKANLHLFGGLKKMPLRGLSNSNVKEPQKEFGKPQSQRIGNFELCI